MKLVLIIIAMVFGLQIANAKDVILVENNHCSLETQVNKESVQKLKFCLADKVVKRKAQNYPIYLVINSGGGSIYWGLRFIEFAKSVRNLQTVTIYAASMAAGIVEALPGVRHATENAIFMFHRATGTFRGQFEDGELESQLRMWKTIVRKMEKTNANRIGITLPDYKKKVKDEWWAYGQESVDLNIADKITPVRCSVNLVKKVRKTKVKTIFGTMVVTSSACPLVN